MLTWCWDVCFRDADSDTRILLIQWLAFFCQLKFLHFFSRNLASVHGFFFNCSDMNRIIHIIRTQSSSIPWFGDTTLVYVPKKTFDDLYWPFRTKRRVIKGFQVCKLHPGRLTWNLQITHEKKGKWSEPNLHGIMFQPLIFRVFLKKGDQWPAQWTCFVRKTLYKVPWNLSHAGRYSVNYTRSHMEQLVNIIRYCWWTKSQTTTWDG